MNRFDIGKITNEPAIVVIGKRNTGISYLNSYTVEVVNDMGHITLQNASIKQGKPNIYELERFVHNKVHQYVNYATDTDGIGCRFYILKPGMKKQWSYIWENTIVNITYNLNTFDPNKMKYC